MSQNPNESEIFILIQKMKKDYDLNLTEKELSYFKLNEAKGKLKSIFNIREFNDTISINDIKSLEIREYYIKKYPVYFLNKPLGYILELKDVDTKLFEIKKVIIDEKLNEIRFESILKIKNTYIEIPISEISSQSIRNYCINQIISNNDTDKIKCAQIITTMYYDEDDFSLKFRHSIFKSLSDPSKKVYILKYIFSKYKKLNDIAFEEENELVPEEYPFDIFINYPTYLIDLIKQSIQTNNIDHLIYLLKYKTIKLKNNEYKKLQDYAIDLRLFELVNILIEYESLEYMLDDKVEIKESNLKDELWN